MTHLFFVSIWVHWGAAFSLEAWFRRTVLRVARPGHPKVPAWLDRVLACALAKDPELRYPKGAGRVAFSNQQSYIAAISASKNDPLDAATPAAAKAPTI